MQKMGGLSPRNDSPLSILAFESRCARYMKKSVKFILSTTLFFEAMPSITFAFQDSIVYQVVYKLWSVVGAVIPLLLGVISIVFLWNVIKFITSAGDEGKRAEAQKMIMYSVVGMFVAMAVWGLVWAMSEFLGVGVGNISGTSIPTYFDGHN